MKEESSILVLVLPMRYVVILHLTAFKSFLFFLFSPDASVAFFITYTIGKAPAAPGALIENDWLIEQ